MKYDPQKHHRRSIRLPGYDYAQPGYYFITICSHNRTCLFGEIINGVIILNATGHIIKTEWQKTAEIRPNIELDEFVVMPNHLHGIIVIIENDGRGTAHRAPTHEQFGKPTSNSIPTIVRSFKATTTKQINQLQKTPGEPIWQRNYYEHIIRNDNELYNIRKYIMENPMKWSEDRFNPFH